MRARPRTRLAEALQRSLLTDAASVDGISLAVGYRWAAERARVGGHWYDAFLGPDGQLNVVVGDVTGHDQASAAAMAQLRNLLRGVAWTLADGSPAPCCAHSTAPRKGSRWGPRDRVARPGV